MSEKTTGQKLLEKLEAEAAAIHKSMADAEIASKIAVKTKAVAEDVVEEIVDDSNLLIKKVKAFLPSRQTAFHVLKIVAYWEAVKLMLGFIL